MTIRFKKIITAITLVFMAVAMTVTLTMLPVSTTNISSPEKTHEHFRLQVAIDGEFEDFTTPEYQEQYEKGICSGLLTETPIHLHDDNGQMVHLHWDGVTGGQLLKYYGLNYIKGGQELLGTRTDDTGAKVDVPIRGEILPKPSEGSRMWVYVNDSSDDLGYVEYDNNGFLKTDIEKVLTGYSEEQSASVNDDTISTDTNNEYTQKELSIINNVLGDIVVYVQQSEPTQEELTEAFKNFSQLEESVCGG